MLVKFFKRGSADTSRGEAVRNYLLGPNFNYGNGVIRDGATLLQGNPAHTTEIINQSPYQKKYLSGCLSFHPDEPVSRELKYALMAGFEDCLLPGLEKNQYSCYWVEHTDKRYDDKPRLELNFVIASTELTSGRYLNTYYHYADMPRVDLWQTLVNHQYGLMDPKSPEHLHVFTQHPRQRLPATQKEKKQRIHEQVHQAVRAGRVTDRQSLLAYLTEQGYQTSRVGKTSISLSNPDGQNLKFKGAYYQSDFNAATDMLPTIGAQLRQYEQQMANQLSERVLQYQVLIEQRRQELAKRFKRAKSYAGVEFLAQATPKPSKKTALPSAKLDLSQALTAYLSATSTKKVSQRRPSSTNHPPRQANSGITTQAKANHLWDRRRKIKRATGHFVPIKLFTVNSTVTGLSYQQPPILVAADHYNYELMVMPLNQIRAKRQKQPYEDGLLAAYLQRRDTAFRHAFSLVKHIQTQPEQAWQPPLAQWDKRCGNHLYHYRHTRFGLRFGGLQFGFERISIWTTSLEQAPKTAGNPLISAFYPALASLTPTQSLCVKPLLPGLSYAKDYTPTNTTPITNYPRNWAQDAFQSAISKRTSELTDLTQATHRLRAGIGGLATAFAERSHTTNASMASQFTGFEQPVEPASDPKYAQSFTSVVNRAAENHQQLTSQLRQATADDATVRGYHSTAVANHRQLKHHDKQLNERIADLSVASGSVANTSQQLAEFLKVRPAKLARLAKNAPIAASPPTSPNIPATPKPAQPLPAKSVRPPIRHAYLKSFLGDYENSHPQVTMTTYLTTASLLSCWVDIRKLGLTVTPEDKETAQIEVRSFEPSVAVPAHFQPVGEALARRLYGQALKQRGGHQVDQRFEGGNHADVVLQTPMRGLFADYPSLRRLCTFLQESLTQMGVMHDYERMPIEVFAHVHQLELADGLVDKLAAVMSEKGVKQKFVDRLVEQGRQEAAKLRVLQAVQAQLGFEEFGDVESVEPKQSVPKVRQAENDDLPSP